MNMKNVKAETKLDGLPKITSTIKSVLEPQQLKSSKMPYADKRYGLTVYNPPPNELGFLGGLGKRTGNVRSKAHIQRPSMNQILFKMRTANKILVSFSEDPIMSNSFITTQQLKKSPKLPIKTNKKDLNQKISQIQIADNVIKVSKGFKGNSTTSETERYLNAESKKKVEVVVAETKKSKGLSFGAMKKLSILSALKKEEVKESVEEVQSFRAWAMAEREKRHEALQQVSSQQIKQEREANEFFPKVKRRPKTYLGMSKRDRGLLPGAEHLGGYLYGGFIEDSGPDATMLTQTKFNVPYTMFSRAQVESKVRAMSRKKIQSARLEYMKIPQIPSDSENSDDIYEDIKGLSLVRTPYFSIPTITTTKVKRVERLRSKYLKGNRLKRINLLLFDRKLSAEKYREKYASSENDFMSFQTEVEERNENDVEGKKTIEQQLLDTSTSSNCLPLMEIKANVRKTFDSEYRQRYHDFLTEKYLEKLEQYNKNLDQKLIAYENREMQPSALSVKTFSDRKSFRDYSVETMSSNAPSATSDIRKDPAFKKVKRKIRKNMKFSQTDNRTGGFYFDPFLLEKVHNPEKGMKIMKNYTSLMRSQSNIRKRLQVNAPAFEEERCGTKEMGSFYHRLATEWDPHYVNEIRYRPTVKKFCIKTDIIKIREMVRKKFFLFFMQEDLMNLFAKQEIENEMINKTTKFIKACEPQFQQLQNNSFEKAKEKLKLIDTVTVKTNELQETLRNRKDQMDLLMQKLMFDERRWESIMMMQNYYYLIMMPLWRLENDWIHRNKTGQLKSLKKSVIYCKKIHIRSKSVTEISLHAIKKFFETSIEPKKLDQMRKIKPDVSLLRASLEGIKSNVLGILNKHNEIMLKSSEILFQQQELEKTIPLVISAYEKNMSYIDERVKFVENRIMFLIKEVETTSNIPLMKCVKNIFMRKIDAISRHLCKTLFNETYKVDESIKKYSLIENFCMISNRTMNLLSQLDNLPTEILHSAENETRLHHRNKMCRAKVAMNEQNLFKMLENQLHNHFTPTNKPKSKSRGKPKLKTVSLFSIPSWKPNLGK